MPRTHCCIVSANVVDGQVDDDCEEVAIHKAETDRHCNAAFTWSSAE